MSMIKELLGAFLVSDTPEVLCVRGPWGVGKTYAWNAALLEATNEGRLATARYSYVSLFGLSSIEAVRMAILENFEVLAKDTRARWLGKNAKSATKFVPAIATLLGQSDLANAAGALAFSVVRNQVICIDDVERRNTGLRLEDVFGLASYLNETRRCRVIILLNEDQLGTSEHEYRKYFEKVVTRSAIYRPDPASIALVGITGTGPFDDMLRKDCTALGISNIRIIQRAANVGNEASRLTTGLHKKVLEGLSHSCALLSWSHYQGEGAPPVEYLRRYQSSELDDFIEAPKSGEETAWDEKLALYGWGMLDELDHVLLERLANGFLEVDRLTVALSGKDKEHRAADRTQRVTEAWNTFHASFEDNEEQIVSMFREAYEANKKEITPSRLDGILGLLRTLGHDDLADKMASEYTSMREGGQSAFSSKELGGYDPISDPLLLELFAKRHIELSPPSTIGAELAELAGRDGSWNETLLQNLASYSADDFERVFRSLKGEALTDTIRSCLQFQSISNADEHMRSIIDKTKSALRNIAGDSPLNAYRMHKFGIRV